MSANGTTAATTEIRSASDWIRGGHERDPRSRGHTGESDPAVTDVGVLDEHLGDGTRCVERMRRQLALAEARQVGERDDESRAGEAVGDPTDDRLLTALGMRAVHEVEGRPATGASGKDELGRNPVDFERLHPRLGRQRADDPCQNGHVEYDGEQDERSSPGGARDHARERTIAGSRTPQRRPRRDVKRGNPGSQG